MPKFKNLASTSEGAGFQYYDQQSFSFNVPSRTFAKFTGTYNHETFTYKLDKNRLGKAITSEIMINVLANLDQVDNPGVYRLLNTGDQGNKTIGSSGGFPIFYNWNISISADREHIIFTVDIGNSSAVNDVTTEAFIISGKIFFYLAPF